MQQHSQSKMKKLKLLQRYGNEYKVKYPVVMKSGVGDTCSPMRTVLFVDRPLVSDMVGSET